MNPPVVPHPNICGACVVAHVTLKHLLQSTFCMWEHKEAWGVMKMCSLNSSNSKQSHGTQDLRWSVTCSASSTVDPPSVSGARALMSPLKLWCSFSWFLSWLYRRQTRHKMMFKWHVRIVDTHYRRLEWTGSVKTWHWYILRSILYAALGRPLITHVWF